MRQALFYLFSYNTVFTTVSVVDDEAQDDPACEEEVGQGRQFIDEVEADDDADRGDDIEQGAMEFPRDFRVFAAHGDDADEVDQEDGQRPRVG